jgi:predicted heme/steroid binding protein
VTTTYIDLHDDEVRVRDAATGGEKGAKLTQVGALDPVSLIEVSRVAGYGANKYAAFNFLKGYDWSLSFNAGMRHAMLFWSGEDIDEESKRYHAAMAAWHFLTLTSFVMRGIGNDDRPPRLPAPEGLPHG